MEATTDAEAALAPPSSSCSECDARTIKELLQAGVGINRVAALFQGRVSEQDVNRLAREAVYSAGGAEVSELGTLVLERSKSAARDPVFLSRQMEVLTSDAPDELLDPLFSTLMKDPVVISSGYVLDRSTVLDPQGRLKFSECPFSRAPLKKDVYPLIEKSSKIKEFKQKRLDAMTLTAETLLEEENWEHFDKVIAAAEVFLDDIGEETYQHRSRRLAELRLAAAEKPGRVVAPDDMAKIYIRIHRTIKGFGDAEAFRQRLSKFKESITGALAEDRVEVAGEWYAAWLVVQRTCKVPPPGLERLGLEIAKRRGGDLTAPRRLVIKSLGGDEEALNQFLREEGVDLASLVDRRPFLLRLPRLRSSQPDDQWHEALASQELPAPVAMVKVHADRFVDQNWGNVKTKVALALYDTDMTLVARCDLFGTYRAEEYAYGDEPWRTLLSTEDVVRLAEAGHVYKLEYSVGGGGGHSIEVNEWQCKVYFAGYAPNVSNPLQMRGADGREGDYVGPLDAEGKASGNGELVFSNIETLVGRFDRGELVEGVLWARHEPLSAIDGAIGAAATAPTPVLLGKFPHDFVVQEEGAGSPRAAAGTSSSSRSRSSSPEGSDTDDF